MKNTKEKKIKEELYVFSFMEASGPDGNSLHMLSIYSHLKLNQTSFLTFIIYIFEVLKSKTWATGPTLFCFWEKLPRVNP